MSFACSDLITKLSLLWFYFGVGWTKVEAIDSLMRKAGYSGAITESLRKRVRLTRYQSTLFTLHYSEYASYVKATRGAAPYVVGGKPSNNWFFQTAFADTAKLVWPKQKNLFKLKKKRKETKVGWNRFVYVPPHVALVIVITCLYHSSNSFDFEEGTDRNTTDVDSKLCCFCCTTFILQLLWESCAYVNRKPFTLCKL